MLSLEGSSLWTLMRDGFIYQSKFWSCLNFLSLGEKLNSKTDKMQLFANLSFLILSSTSDLSSPNSFVESFRIPAGADTPGPRWLLSRPPALRLQQLPPVAIGCPLGKRQPVPRMAACCRAGRQPSVGTTEPPLEPSSLEEESSSPIFTKAHRTWIVFETFICKLWLKWADRLNRGWMQGQHHHICPVFLRNLAQLLSLVVEESFQFHEMPCPSMNLKVQKLEGNTKHLGGRFSGMVFSYALRLLLVF